MELSIREKKNNQQKTDWLILGSFILTFLICSVVYGTLLQNGIFRWPFRRIDGVAETYKNIFYYSPILIAALASLTWLKASGFLLERFLKWQRSSNLFWLCVIISAGYSIYLCTTCRFSLKGYEYWPAVVILSLMNAVSEECVFRLTLYNLVKKFFHSPIVPNLAQSILYASIHIPIGGIRFALAAFCYGLLLGFILERDKSITPCIICHFLIDIGNIGLPLLITLPVS